MAHQTIPKPVDTFGSRLRACRLAADKTRDALAVEAGVGSATVTRIENGHVRPHMSTMRALAVALGVSVDALLNDVAPAGNRREVPTSTAGLDPDDAILTG